MYGTTPELKLFAVMQSVNNYGNFNDESQQGF
jgi:hypothetical protein